MKRSSALVVGAVALLFVVWTVSLLLALPYLQPDLNPSDHMYLESCRRELKDIRDGKSAGRRYDLNPNQPEIDIVYTWVNGSDPDHQRELEHYQKLENKTSMCERDNVPLSECIEASKRRFEDHGELKFSLRSVEAHMPWVRKIFIVTNGQVPSWLNVSHPKIHLVTHKEIFKWPEHLPTFNSLAIESHLHRIPGISDHFIYFNDDMMLANTVYPTTWYNQNDGQRLWFFWPLEQHPDVSYPKRQFYFRNRRCPECECEAACDKITVDAILSSSDGTAAKSSAYRNTPYFKKEVGSSEPPVKLTEEWNWERIAASGVAETSDERFPSEKVVKEVVEEESKVESETRTTGRQELAFGQRKLLAGDSVGQSLLKTHKLMHETFGFADRMEPSHVPLYIQKDVMNRLRQRFPDEYYSVSSHRFREPLDIHFHFSYSYFLMHERKPFDFATVFAEMDVDHSSVLEHLELQRLATTVLLGLHQCEYIYRSPPLSTSFGKELLKECDFAKMRLSAPYASRSELESCPSAMSLIKDWYTKKLRNRFVLGSDESDSSFLQVGTSFQLKREIDSIYSKQPKFVCLNDDIDYRKKDEAQAYLKLVQNFYHTLYPLPSSFELDL